MALACGPGVAPASVRQGLIPRNLLALIARTVLLGLTMLSGSGVVTATVAQESVTTIKVDELSREQLRKLWPTLPDDAVLESRGNRVTVGEMRARLQEQAAAAKWRAEQFEREARAAFEQRRAAFLESEKARLAANHKEALAAFERLAADTPTAPEEVAAIREEVWRLRERGRTANPQELAEIERRVEYLVRRYSALAPPQRQD